ncbi:MAG: right-handed parallel beta-helix repeat-containing protein [Cellvibrionaceae bacterium]
MKHLIGLTAMALLSTTCLAKDLFVSSSGSDNTSYDNNNINAPWKTLIHAIYNLKAGDTLYIREGTYSPQYSLRLHSTYDSQNYGGHPTATVNAESGTVNSPVLITAYENEEVIIDLETARTFMFIENKNYWQIKNLSLINSASAFVVSLNAPADNIVFENLKIYAKYGGDNSANIKVHSYGGTNVLIKNNLLEGPGTTSDIHQNTAVVYARKTPSVTIEGNNISNAPIGIYFKHVNDTSDANTTDILISDNFIHNTTRDAIQLNARYATVTNNIFGENCSGLNVTEANGGPGGDFNTISHNTFWGCGLTLRDDTQAGDLYPGSVGNTISNNIFANNLRIHPYTSLNHNSTLSNNLYVNSTITNNGTEYTLDSWKSFSNQDSGSTENSVSFIADNQKNKLGFILNDNSAGKKSAPDGSDLGANIDLSSMNDALHKDRPSKASAITLD